MVFKTYKLILFTLLFQMTFLSYSQKQSTIGINLTEEWTSNANFRTGVGLTFERQMDTRPTLFIHWQ